jgi:hypothetical protein
VVEWAAGIVTINFDTYEFGMVKVTGVGFVRLLVPKRDEWGESVSVNGHEGPQELCNGNQLLTINIQSGDKIELEAKSIFMPIS